MTDSQRVPAAGQPAGDSPGQPLLAREGWPHVAVAATAAVLVQALCGLAWALPLWVATAFVVQFFRDPRRAVPAVTDGIICPADGRVVSVGQVHDEWLNRPALRISIFMNVFSVHANRIPLSGVVRERWYRKGRFVNAALDKSSAENECNALWIRGDSGADVVCVQVAGLIARRILCYVDTGDRVTAGQRYGFIRFGSRVDLLLPADAVPEVRLGDRVYGACQVIAHLMPTCGR